MKKKYLAVCALTLGLVACGDSSSIRGQDQDVSGSYNKNLEDINLPEDAMDDYLKFLESSETEGDDAETENVEDSVSGCIDRLKRKVRNGKFLFRAFKFIYDADNNYLLDSDEKDELIADLEDRHDVKKAEFLAEFDTDGDGEISEDEADFAIDTLHERREDEHLEREQNDLAEFDADGDGELNWFERLERHEARSFNAQLLAEFDADGDDELSDTEIETARETLRERIRTGERLFS